MDVDERRQYGAYLRCLADLLGLRDWTVTLDVSSDAGPYGATVERIYGRKIARVAVSPEFFTMPAEEQRQTLVHELLHCHLGGAQDAGRVLGGVLSSEAYGAWWPLFDHQIEFAVDALADMLAFHLPLPERWPERVRDRGGASALASDSREALVNLFFHERKGKPMVWNGVAWQEPDGVMPDRAAGDRQEGPMAE